MKNQEAKNEALIGGSGLNAGLAAEPVDFTCPFCGGHDYDLIGALVDQPPADDAPANYEAFPILAATRAQLTPNSI